MTKVNAVGATVGSDTGDVGEGPRVHAVTDDAMPIIAIKYGVRQTVIIFQRHEAKTISSAAELHPRGALEKGIERVDGPVHKNGHLVPN